MDLNSGISQRQLVELMEYIRDKKISIWEAMKKLGLDKRISETTARGLIRREMLAGSKLAGDALAASAGTSSGGLWGLFGRLGGWLGRLGGVAIEGTAATVVGGLALTGALAGLTYFGANLAGSYAGDSSVQPWGKGDMEARRARGDIPVRPTNVKQDMQPDAKPVVAKTLDASGNWELTWNWSVTTVYFVGQVTGGPGQWKFQGTLDRGGNAIWTAAQGSATVACTLKGDPLEPPGKGTLDCTATFSDGNWTGEAEGTTNTVTSGDGKLQFKYEGAGWGSSQTSERAHIDHLDLAPRTGN
jgi:hypothetical protein